MNVLFVCTGNICRSPMAEYLARALTPGDDVVFSSAGTGTRGGAEISSGAAAVMAEAGVPLAEHRSRSVWENTEEADVIYALAAEHRDALVDRWPERAADIQLLDPGGRSVEDPYGMDLAAYRTVRAEIEAAVRARISGGWKP